MTIVKQVTEFDRECARVWYKAVDKFNVDDSSRTQENVDIRSAFIHTASRSIDCSNHTLSELTKKSYGIITRTLRDAYNENFPSSRIYHEALIFFRRELLGEEDSKLTDLMLNILTVISQVKEDINEANQTLNLVKRSIDISYIDEIEKEIKKTSSKNIEKLKRVNTEYRKPFNKNTFTPIEKLESIKVYVMIDHNTGYYKIGYSRNPTRRERTLQSEKPTIELLFSYEAEMKDEKALHKLFEDKRIRGEWFRLNNSDLLKIKKYLQV